MQQGLHKDEIKKSVIKNDNGKKEVEHRAITKDTMILRPAENLNSRAFNEKLAKRLDKEIKSEQHILDLEIEKERIKKRRLKDF